MRKIRHPRNSFLQDNNELCARADNLNLLGKCFTEICRTVSHSSHRSKLTGLNASL